MRALTLLSLLCLLAACTEPQPAPPVAETPPATAEAADNAWPHGYMAAVANPYATDAAVAMLEQGGHAVDACLLYTSDAADE